MSVIYRLARQERKVCLKEALATEPGIALFSVYLPLPAHPPGYSFRDRSALPWREWGLRVPETACIKSGLQVRQLQQKPQQVRAGVKVREDVKVAELPPPLLRNGKGSQGRCAIHGDREQAA